MQEKVLFSWSGGKDSMMALHEVCSSNQYEIAALLTTVTEGYNRISMHGVRNELLEAQTNSLNFPLQKVWIPKKASNEIYEAQMERLLKRYQSEGVNRVIFGDIFLEDLRIYREKQLARIGMKGVFPIWKRDTKELAHRFIDLGYRAVIACVDTHVLDQEFTGRTFDHTFLRDLPEGIDPCGEYGEFHSFVYGGPLFQQNIAHERGEMILREERFSYCDLVPILPPNHAFGA
jgi:uncharacterized protein (TIGR00290 family)